MKHRIIVILELHVESHKGHIDGKGTVVDYVDKVLSERLRKGQDIKDIGVLGIKGHFVRDII